jgi:hypothetical protein
VKSRTVGATQALCDRLQRNYTSSNKVVFEYAKGRRHRQASPAEPVDATRITPVSFRLDALRVTRKHPNTPGES